MFTVVNCPGSLPFGYVRVVHCCELKGVRCFELLGCSLLRTVRAVHHCELGGVRSCGLSGW